MAPYLQQFSDFIEPKNIFNFWCINIIFVDYSKSHNMFNNIIRGVMNYKLAKYKRITTAKKEASDYFKC